MQIWTFTRSVLFGPRGSASCTTKIARVGIGTGAFDRICIWIKATRFGLIVGGGGVRSVAFYLFL